MTAGELDDDPEHVDLEAVVAERRRLLALCYRMLGSLAEAEDAVQATYVRWYRMEQREREAVLNPQGWLTRTASRICLDLLGSARARRERYVGEWLPEPVPADLFRGTVPAPAEPSPRADPLAQVTLDDEVSTALLVVMGSMTPAERVAFVLHDVFAVPFPEIAGIVGRSPAAVRQLASAARRRVRSQTPGEVDRARHDEVVRAFARASREGDLGALAALLDPAVVLRSDGGGVVSAARRPVFGADKVARFLAGVRTKSPDLAFSEVSTGDGAALLLSDGTGVRAVLNLGVRGGVVTDVWLQVNPEKLRAWSSPAR
ncbi:RNA polymerase sigma-70 factor (ECF subfamily) [Friedmanniella endophytica]|uniref:RNA polymerase sigma-70 factor (ECF subfamily) n=1 Tax=Microlunatus kandeliicorticis TaxID=1759536 RepID=A0A7W3P7I3_9ACTN|nr:RNA polymerase sigma factor SigJ [Microlunatus kandeliicorticis]MBA8796049.1 RNA polymerase sigma-70 factor (ECF subfamily) [Microlunatus kandeliicorticis]